MYNFVQNWWQFNFVSKSILKLVFHILKFKLILKKALLRFQCWYAKRPERKKWLEF